MKNLPGLLRFQICEMFMSHNHLSLSILPRSSPPRKSSQAVIKIPNLWNHGFFWSLNLLPLHDNDRSIRNTPQLLHVRCESFDFCAMDSWSVLMHNICVVALMG